MLISGRQAAALLEAAGLTRRQSRQLLAAGLAGLPFPTSRAHLYETSRVQELASRAPLTDVELDNACPGPLFVSRREVDVLAPRNRQLAAVQSGWDLNVATVIWLRHGIRERGYVPMVAALCGFVVLGAEITDLHRCAKRDVALSLREPGAWFDELRDRRVVMGRGRDFAIRGWRLYTRPGDSDVDRADRVGD